MDEVSLSALSSVRRERADPAAMAGQSVLTDQADHGGSNAALALALLRVLPDSVYLMNPDGRVTFVNRVAAANLKAGGRGFAAGSPDTAAGRDRPHGQFWWELWPDALEADLRSMLAAALEGESGEFEALCPGPDGAAQGCLVTLAPIEDISGDIAKVVCIARAV